MPKRSRTTEYDIVFDDFKTKDMDDVLQIDFSDPDETQSATSPFKSRIKQFNADPNRQYDIAITTSAKECRIYISKEPKGSVKPRKVKAKKK